jgi:hypothetical protein
MESVNLMELISTLKRRWKKEDLTLYSEKEMEMEELLFDFSSITNT